MTSREIAELTGKEHMHVMRDIRSMFLELQLPQKGYIQNWIHPQNGQGYQEFVLDCELTYTLLTGYSAVARRRVIARWHKLESDRAAPAVPKTLSAALRLAADQSDLIEQQQALLAIAAPKAAFVDAYVDSTGLKGFREVAKLLKANESCLREYLVKNKIMYRLGGEWTAYHHHIYAGRFVVKTGISQEKAAASERAMFEPAFMLDLEWVKYRQYLNEQRLAKCYVKGHVFNWCLFTPKGIEWLAARWAIHCVNLGLSN